MSYRHNFLVYENLVFSLVAMQLKIFHSHNGENCRTAFTIKQLQIF